MVASVVILVRQTGLVIETATSAKVLFDFLLKCSLVELNLMKSHHLGDPVTFATREITKP